MKCKRSIRVLGLLAIMVSLMCVAWNREEYTIYLLRVNNIRGGTNGATITLTDPVSCSSTFAVVGAQTVTGAFTVTGDTTLNSDVILESDEMLRNDVDGDVEIIFDETNATMGQLIFDTSKSVALQADNDLYEIVHRSLNSATAVVDYATIQLKKIDDTGATEDGAIVFLAEVNSTETTLVTIGASGLVVNSGEATVDGKYAAVGGDASTALMMQKGTANLGAAGTVTSSFAVVFGAAPIVTWSYTSAPATSNVFYTGTVTASNVIFFGSASDTLGYIALGTRP